MRSRQIKSRAVDDIAYNLKPWRDRAIRYVNTRVRNGETYSQIAAEMNVSRTTVQNYYYGRATNCLTEKQIEERHIKSGLEMVEVQDVTGAMPIPIKFVMHYGYHVIYRGAACDIS